MNVQCNLNNGLRLTLGNPWFSSHSLDLVDREPLLLSPGLNVLDSEDTAFFRAWAQAHLDSPLLKFAYEA